MVHAWSRRESEAAVLGASTTPGAGWAPFVLDLGGGTVDLHRAAETGEQAISTAGAGELVTRICAALLACGSSTAERAKRSRSARVESPFTLHHEDGSRSFLGDPAPPGALARLCVLDGRELTPLDAPLAPEVWRSLRRAAKRDVIARNVRRAVEAAGGVPRGELVTLVGGSACDGEVVDAVAAELTDLDVAVARGDVLGRHGPAGGRRRRPRARVREGAGGDDRRAPGRAGSGARARGRVRGGRRPAAVRTGGG